MSTHKLVDGKLVKVNTDQTKKEQEKKQSTHHKQKKKERKETEKQKDNKQKSQPIPITEQGLRDKLSKYQNIQVDLIQELQKDKKPLVVSKEKEVHSKKVDKQIPHDIIKENYDEIILKNSQNKDFTSYYKEEKGKREKERLIFLVKEMYEKERFMRERERLASF